MYDFLMHPCTEPVRVLAHFQFPDTAIHIYLNVSWKWIPRRVHSFCIIAYTIFTWCISRRHIFCLILHTDTYVTRIQVCLIIDRQYVAFRSIICIDERFLRRPTNANVLCQVFSWNYNHGVSL